MTLIAQLLEDIFRVAAIFLAVGVAKTVERDVEVGKVALMLFIVAANQFLRRDAGPPRIDFDGSAMGVVGAHVDRVLSGHFKKAHVDIGHDVLNQMAEMNAAIGIG